MANSIKGTIYDQYNAPAPNLLIRAFEKDLRNETLLGEAKTNSRGQYSISYEESSFSRAENKTADVFLRILIRLNDNNQQEIAKSPTHFNVPDEHILDYKIGGTPYQGASEFDSLIDLLEPLLMGQRVKFHDLKEDDEHQDISFLSAETGIDPAKIALLPIAFKNNIKTKNNIAPDIFYGLLRVQFPARLEDLLRIQGKSIRQGIEEATSKNIISPSWVEKIPDIVDQFNVLYTQFVLKSEETENLGFQKIIGATLINKKQQKTFIDILHATEDEPDKFWDKLAKKPGFRDSDRIEETKKVLRLNRITDQPVLAARLYKEHEELKELREYAKLTVSDFSRHISALVSDGSFGEFPAEIEGKTPEEKTKNYAIVLEDRMREVFTTDAFKFRLKADQADPFGPVTPDLTRFLDRNPEMDIMTTKIDSTLQQADFNGIDNRERLEKTLKQVNRVSKLTPRYESTRTLLGEGLDSATAIATLSKKEFISKTQGKIPKTESEKIYEKSVRISQRAAALAMRYRTANDIAVYALNGGETQTANFKSIFDDTNLCDCVHYQSVYSPSAYLVDMLGIMKKREPQAFDEFVRRRTDVTHIKLTCENTNTGLPYIDLVNEVLENQIANDGLVDPTSVPQTTLSSEELAAFPEHENAVAYDKLAVDFSAPQLPFNLPLEKTRLFLGKLKCPRYSLMELFFDGKTNEKYNDIFIAAEYLKWSVEELNNLSGEKPLPDANIDEVKINEVAYYLKLTGLTYAQLQEILKSEVVASTGLSIEIEDTDNNAATCDIDLMRFKGMDIVLLKKHQRLVRLWKKLGWSIEDLDAFFKVFNTANFDSDPNSFNLNITLPLSHSLRLKDAFKWSIPQIMALWTGNPAATRNAFAISESEFELYNQAPAMEDIPGLSGESGFYRYTILAKKLGITVEEVWQLIALTSVSPYGGLSATADTLKFIDLATLIKGCPFSVPELFDLLRSSKADLSQVDQPAVNSFFDELQAGLLELDAEISDPIERSAAREKLIADVFAVAFNMEPEVAAVFMADHASSPWFEIDDNGTFNWLLPDLVNTFRVLKAIFTRLALIRDKLSIELREIQYFHKNKTALQITGIWNLPDDNNTPEQYPVFENLLYLLKFRDSLEEPPSDWFTLFDPLLENATNSKNQFVEAFTSLSKSEKANIEFLIGTDTNSGALNYTFPDDFLKGENLIEILACLKRANQLDASPQELSSLTKSKPSQTEAAIAEKLWKSRYNEKDGLEALQEINKPLREEKRKAMVSYLLYASESASFRSKNKINNSNDLYALFFMDVDMSACMMTSRIKQAISSVQLFIDRCLMGLEKTISGQIEVGESFAKQMIEWRKVYRIWEANRKVFLYPENWIEPELRNDKSPFFKELESKLSQNEVTDDLAKEALLEYLEKLDAVANLEIIAFFPDEATKITHVLGRTKNIPHQYFYRKEENSIWTAWEPVELDIQGDHVLLVVWNNRLMVFWGEFTEKQDSSGTVSLNLSGGTEDGTITSPPPQKFLEMKLNWSEYKNGKWGAKKVSEEVSKLVSRFKRIYFLSSFTSEEGLFIRILFSQPQSANNDNPTPKIRGDHESLDIFHFRNCNSSPRIQSVKDLIIGINTFSLKGIKGTKKNSMFINELNSSRLNIFENGLFLLLPNHNPNEIELFGNTPGNFQILANHHTIEENKTVRFFYNNEDHNFYVKSYQQFIKDELDQGVFADKIVLTRSAVSPSSVNPFKNDTGLALFLPEGEVEGDNVSSSHPVADLPTTTQPTPESNPERSPSFIYRKRYQFQTFYHPYICKYIEKINTEGIDALYKVSEQDKLPKELFNNTQYQPNEDNVKKPYPVEEVNFSTSGTYSLYNWELFFHIPFLMATKLNQNQKFDEARKWFHYIFDPTMPVTTGDTTAKRFWITKPFRTEIENSILSIEELINQEENESELKLQLKHWENNHFQPHVVANFRPSAYMRATLMKYIDNLIDWGDQLFRRDSIESINEATLMYVLAQNLLGKKQSSIEALEQPQATTFDEIKDDLNPFNVAKVAIESYLSPDDFEDGTGLEDVVSLPLFCIPKNEELIEYWDTVADRLFKIRNCQNIEGIVRQLPLFELPIDPGLLVRAASAGLELNEILNDSQVAVPHYRFQVMLQKANEFCNDIKSLGSQLLAAYEKRDAEELSLLRSNQEIKLMELVRDIKKRQVDEAKENIKSLQGTRKVAEERKNYYESREFLNQSEGQYFDLSMSGIQSQRLQIDAERMAFLYSLYPDVKAGSPTTVGFTIGGSTLGASKRVEASRHSTRASINNAKAALSNSTGGYVRRMEDWKFQAKIADLELKQIDKQLIASEIRLAITEKDLSNHEVQMEQSKKVDDYLRGKFTNKELYEHMVKQSSSIFFQSYQLAYDLAKKAEKCYLFELGITESNIIKFGHWDSLKKGLLSGEKLQFDLRRLETSYLENNKREFELSKHISLKLLNPLALLKLRETGKCDLSLPEELFDLDYPGHYFRRIKSVSISLPCIVGPYTTVSCTLSLTKNEFRNIDTGNQYLKVEEEDSRFSKNFIPIKSIATSSAQNDSGVFELNFRDERYLPFERAGAISNWQLELSTDKDLRQFEYSTITDVILHLNYTARDGSAAFKKKASDSLKAFLKTTDGAPSMKIINLKHDFPSEWHKLLTPSNPSDGNILDFKITSNLFPYRDKLHTLKINTITLLAKCSNIGDYNITFNPPLSALPEGSDEMTLKQDTSFGNLHFDTKDTSGEAIELDFSNEINWNLKVESPSDKNLEEKELEEMYLILGFEWKD